ncbi:response regulator [Nitrospira moscoviensis]|jgi:DNA-binding NarL/FixJ family response regulator|uniref:Response regulator, LuxR family n=1 Tax=Nitrospira moscoviensis TaxID=42253 RepID=A0A0K2GHK1_NITMO|nr:response regulator transcription factor [Nitrospira moscoviensis]ALA60401.1 Response regulator, LuxR family [Nitrospira moscoviensis]
MSKPRILLGDDHALVLEGFRRILEGQYELVGTAADGRALVDAAKRLQPDIVILDVSMPMLNGINAAAQIRKLNPAIKIIVVTMHADTDYVRSAFEAGASAYVLKRSAVDELEQAIRAVIAGHSYITPLITKDLLDVFLAKASEKPGGTDGLTLRQREVLQLLAEGRTAKEIANVLNISSRTVEFHKGQILDQLNLHTTADLIKYAVTHGIVAPS